MNKKLGKKHSSLILKFIYIFGKEKRIKKLLVIFLALLTEFITMLTDTLNKAPGYIVLMIHAGQLLR